MLLVTVSIWAFNFTVTRYAVTHGFQPLAYSALRFGAAAIVVSGITYGLERSLRFERRHAVLLGGAAISFLGVALVAAGSASGVSGNLAGDLLAFLAAATWGFYSVAIVPLLRRYSVWRISAGALAFGSIPLLITATPQLLDQRWDLE